MAERITDDVEQPSIHQSQESADVLIPKSMLPPALVLLPRPQNHPANSLLPMLPLPIFAGVIPSHQPLDNRCREIELTQYPSYVWIGQAFTNIVYRKYNESSYQKIDNYQQNWNLWGCDLVKLISQKQQTRSTNHADLSPFYTKKCEDDRTIIFESRFESGNLSLASKVTDTQYNLLLQNDINTSGYSQWFFFKVSNVHKGLKVKFNILNMSKENSLYNSGMKIVTYSTKESAQNNISWHRAGENIEYYENGYSKSTSFLKRYFTLTWTYTFQYDHDQVYFAYSYPFTYSHLDAYLQKFELDPVQRLYFKRSALCKTLAGNRVDVLTITEDHPDESLEKAHIIISGRVHSGETVSSYVVNGILQFLMSNDERAHKLRQNFIFKIVPMLNPDGVIHGNYRSGVSGHDLNRKWQNPSKSYHPEIYYFKKLILDCHEESEVLLFCDFHGHSMKKNAFIYGCHDDRRPFQGKQFPFLVSKLFQGFSFKDCSFLSLEIREGSSRSVMSQELEIANVFTLQSSFCGPDHENIHFSVQHFEQLGQTFCQALMIYFQPCIKQQYFQAAIRNKFLFEDDHKESMETRVRTQYFEELYQNKSCLFDRVNSENSQGSQPEVEAENIIDDMTLRKFIQMTTRSISQKKKQSIQQAFRQKIKFVIHKSVSKEKHASRDRDRDRDREREDSTDKKDDKKDNKINAAQIAMRKRKQEAIKNKIEIFRKVEPKLFEANEFFNMDQPESRRVIQTRNQSRVHYASEKNLPRKKSLQEDMILASHIKVNSKFEFVGIGESIADTITIRPNGLSIFNNNFLTLLPTQSVSLNPPVAPATENRDSPQLLQAPLYLRNEESRKSVDFKIRRKEVPMTQISPQRPRQSWHNIESMVPTRKKESNIFKNVLDSLRKR